MRIGDNFRLIFRRFKDVIDLNLKAFIVIVIIFSRPDHSSVEFSFMGIEKPSNLLRSSMDRALRLRRTPCFVQMRLIVAKGQTSVAATSVYVRSGWSRMNLTSFSCACLFVLMYCISDVGTYF